VVIYALLAGEEIKNGERKFTGHSVVESLFRRAPRWQLWSPTLLDELQGEAVTLPDT
jgi:hypothetical protein